MMRSRWPQFAIGRLRWLVRGSVRYDSLMVGCFLWLFVGSVAYAVPPNMPHTFDQNTVQSLIDNIDTGDNALILKFGYFARRGGQPFLATDALAVLKKSLSEAQPGSRHWFILASVLGFGALHGGGDHKQDGYATYATIFDHLAEADKVDALNIVQQSIFDLVATVPGNYGVSSQMSDEASSQALLMALRTYLKLLREDHPGQYAIPWTKAIAAAPEIDFQGEIKKALSEAKMPKTPALYRTAAEVYTATNPDLAIELFQKVDVRDLTDKSQASAFYREYVDLLVKRSKFDQAIVVQQACIKATGFGSGLLMVLYLQSKKKPEYETLLSTLSQPNSNEDDVIDAGSQLYRGSQSDQDINVQARTGAESLLNQYLTCSRPRTMENELKARLILSKIFVANHKTESAVSILSIPALPLTSSVITRREYAEVQRLHEYYAQALSHSSGTTDLHKGN